MGEQCPKCGQFSFDYEDDIEEESWNGHGEWVCSSCGYRVDDPAFEEDDDDDLDDDID